MKSILTWLLISASVIASGNNKCDTILHRVVFWGDGTADTFRLPSQFYARDVHSYTSYGIFNAIIFTVYYDCPCVRSDTVQYRNIDCNDNNACTYDDCVRGKCYNANQVINPDSAALAWWKRNCCRCD